VLRMVEVVDELKAKLGEIDARIEELLSAPVGSKSRKPTPARRTPFLASTTPSD